MAVVILADQPLVVPQLGDRVRGAGQALVAVADEAGQHAEFGAGGGRIQYRLRGGTADAAGAAEAADDIRSGPPDWLCYFREGGGAAPEMLARLEAIREVLTSKGRSLVEGVLAWIWASAETAIPIPGFRSEDQVRELAHARGFGAPRPAQMAEISALLTDAAA